jgi:hypothetical protein
MRRNKNAYIASCCCLDILDVHGRLRRRLLVTVHYTVTGADARARAGAVTLAGTCRVVIVSGDPSGCVNARE